MYFGMIRKALLALFFFLFSFAIIVNGQVANQYNDTAAASLLQRVSEKYGAHKNISAEFKLVIQRPKQKPEDSDKKYTDTLSGKILLQGSKFNITIKGQQIICDGKNIWTYMPSENEVQINLYEESDDIFSPSRIFNLYKEGSLYQIKEKKIVNGKKVTVIEMSPANKKLSYFKIDITVDDATLQIVESKIYQKNGTRYTYKLIKQTPGISTTDTSFIFNPAEHPGVKVVDLR